MSQDYKLSDEILYRIVQILQEAILMGIDVTDMLRMIRVTTNETDQLVLSDAYKQQVEKMHEKWLDNVAKLQSEQQTQSESNTKLIN